MLTAGVTTLRIRTSPTNAQPSMRIKMHGLSKKKHNTCIPTLRGDAVRETLYSFSESLCSHILHTQKQTRSLYHIHIHRHTHIT